MAFITKIRANMASGISTHYWKSFTCSKTKQCLTCSLNSPTTLARLNEQIQDVWNNITGLYSLSV